MSDSPNRSPLSAGLGLQEGDARKRVPKACDRCRLKKIKLKCDGQIPCTRCQTDNTLCWYGERKKSIERRIPPGYVEYLEEQQKLLVRALKKAYNLSIPSRSRPRGITEPSVHTMLEELDILPEFPLQHSGQDMNQFEENLEQLRKQYEAEVDVKEQARKSTVTSPQNEASDSAREDKLQTIWFSEQIEPLPNAFGNLHHVQYAQQPSLLQPESSRIPVLEWPTALKNMSGHTSSSVVRHNTPSFVLKEQRAGFPWNRHVWQSQPNATTVSPEDLILPAIPADSSRVLPDDIQWMQWINDHQA